MQTTPPQCQVELDCLQKEETELKGTEEVVDSDSSLSHNSSLSSVASGGELANRMGLVSGAQKADLMSRPCPVRAAYRLPVRRTFFTGAGTL